MDMNRLSLFLLLACVPAGMPGCDRPAVTPIASVAPTGPSPTPASPVRVTLTVRSGAEGLPPIRGATVHINGQSATTDIEGRVIADNVGLPTVFIAEAQGFLSLRGAATAAATDVTLWPLQAGMTDDWIFRTSYYGPDYNRVLWRPVHDVTLRLEGALADAPYRPVWDAAWREVAHVVQSAGLDGPTIRLADAPGAVPVVLVEAPTCHVVSWTVSQGVLSPPPAIRFSSAAAARDPLLVLHTLTNLLGFSLHAGRSAADTAGTLTPSERTALRMRLLRPPGTALLRDLEDTTANAAEGTSAYLCR